MSRIFPFFFIILVLIACGEDEAKRDIYNEAPYAEFTNKIKQNPKNAELYYQRADLFNKNSLRELAELDTRRAWHLDPQEHYAISLANFLKEKNIDSTIAFIQTALKKLPDSYSLNVELAKAYQEKGDVGKALEITNGVLEQHPNLVDALALKSQLIRDEKSDLAISTLEAAYSLVPSDPKIALDLAFEYAEAKNAKALKLTDSLIKANAPQVEKAFYLKGLYYANTGNINEAIKNYDEAIRTNYNLLDAYRDKGQLQFDQKNYAAARKTFELALRVEPEEPQFYYGLAKIDEAEGKKAEAKLNYKKAYELDKSFTEAKEAYDRL
jgi:tetratricopeptide (TPR) repeat protein